MTAGFRVVVFLAACLNVAAAHASLTVQQITNNATNEKGPFRRNSFTTGGQILFVDSDDTVWLYNGLAAATPLQAFPGGDETVNDGVFALGTGSSAGQVVGAWRRGNGYGVVSAGGGIVQTTQNPEAVSVDGGCVFMVLQTATDGNHAYQVDTSNGNVTRLSAGNVNVGAIRISNTGCSKAAWTFQNDSGSVDIQYWNGGTTTTVATGIDQTRGMVDGRIVYSQVVSGIQQVFAINTNVSLSPVQLSNETDSTKLLDPQTDGRHVIWYRSGGGGDHELVLNGDLVFPTTSLTKMEIIEKPFQLNRGQLLWLQGTTYYYDDGMRARAINPAPATTITNPWLTDGYIAFLGSDGSDTEVFRITGTTPSDSMQPSPPLLVQVTAGSGQITVEWDKILGATSYNLYLANEPGVTKDNYTSLAGGRRITGVTSPATISVDANNVYYAAVTAVEGATEGPSSIRPASAFVVGNLSWQLAGGTSSTPFFAVAADQANASLAYAGSSGSVFKSSDGGRNWSQVLSSATSGSAHVTSVAVAGAAVFAGMRDGDIWRSANQGLNWSEALDADSSMFSLYGAIAVDPSNPNIVYAADYVLPGRTNESAVIKSTNGGTNWTHTAPGPVEGEQISTQALAIDPEATLTIYAAGSGTPNVARTDDGGATWLDKGITGFSAVAPLTSVAIDPNDPAVVYAVSRDRGVFKSTDRGGTWVQKSNGLNDVAGGGLSGEYHSIVIDPRDSNYLHLGAANGYWYSTDGAENWIGNRNLGLGAAYVYALSMTPAYQLLAAESGGMYLLSVAPPPVVEGVSPNSGNIGGGAAVTITGRYFQMGATVRFGGTAATNVMVISSTTITATTPPHAVGTVTVTVENLDTQSGSLAGAFTYTNTAPSAPAGVVATAQTTTSVLVMWNASDSATSYQVYRNGTPVGAPTANTSYTDNGLAESTAYLYRVTATNAVGTSAQSNPDIATTVMFSNDPLTAGVTVQAAHLTQLRTAVNAVRTLAGLGGGSFTETPAPGVSVKALHITQIRTALDEALPPLGFSAGGYTDGSLPGVVVKAVHQQEIRNRIK